MQILASLWHYRLVGGRSRQIESLKEAPRQLAQNSAAGRPYADRERREKKTHTQTMEASSRVNIFNCGVVVLSEPA